MSDFETSKDEDPAITQNIRDSFSEHTSPDGSLFSVRHADDILLAELGYKSEFKREFSVRLKVYTGMGCA